MCWAPNARRLERVARFASRTLRLYERGVPLAVVENALVLACARRLARPADAVPLGVIRSLAYFAPVIEEFLGPRVDDAYFQHLRQRLSPSFVSNSRHCGTPLAWMIPSSPLNPSGPRA